MTRKAAITLAAAVLIAGSLQLTRPGYSVDEEFTVFAVRGIHASGVPLLPSGLLYDRGLAYSYASWVAGAVTGSELPAYRSISLVCAALIVLLVFALIKRLAGEVPALIASLLVATSVPFWATATSGRFYAPFFMLYLASLLSLQSSLAIVFI
ncbi:MAG: glycosyltransferase family 39 protein, partial [Vicinamibacterales bacterium]